MNTLYHIERYGSILILHTKNDIRYNIDLESFDFVKLKAIILREFTPKCRKIINKFIATKVPHRYIEHYE